MGSQKSEKGSLDREKQSRQHGTRARGRGSHFTSRKTSNLAAAQRRKKKDEHPACGKGKTPRVLSFTCCLNRKKVWQKKGPLGHSKTEKKRRSPSAGFTSRMESHSMGV